MKRFFLLLSLSLHILVAHATEVDDVIARGDSAYADGQLSEAIILYSHLFSLYESAPDGSEHYAEGFYKGGAAAFTNESYIDALDFWVKGVEVAASEGDSILSLRCLGNIALIYTRFNNHERALYYYNKVYEAAVRMNDQKIQSYTLHNMILSYCHLKRPMQAKRCMRLLDNIPSEYNLNFMNFRRLMLQGYIARAEQNFSLSVSFFNEALEYSYTIDNVEVSPIFELGCTYSQMGEYDTAIDYFNQYLPHLYVSDYSLLECYRLIYETYWNKGQSDSAQAYKSKYLALSDSLYDQRHLTEAQNKFLDYEDRLVEATIVDLHENIHRRNAVIFGIAILVLLLALTVIFIVRQNRRLHAAYLHMVNRNKEYISLRDTNSRLLEQVERLSPTPDMPESEANSEPEAEHDDEDTSETRSSINLSAEQIQMLSNKINHVMADVSIICDPNFSLSSLAKLVHSNTAYISYVINTSYNKNFKTLLNEHRIAEACRRLTDTEHYGNLSIPAIAEQLGYNSINGFTLAFRKVIGMTPSVYQKLANSNTQQIL